MEVHLTDFMSHIVFYRILGQGIVPRVTVDVLQCLRGKLPLDAEID
jgi:hypothetical protein